MLNHRIYYNIKKLSTVLDLTISPLVFFSGLILKMVRKFGMENMPICKRIFNTTGVFPIIDHYYEPRFNNEALRRKLREDRSLEGIDMNVDDQLSIIDQFDFNKELLSFPTNKDEHQAKVQFYFNNPNFKSGDAEFLYNIIRLYKPSKMIEIGSGFSTLLSSAAAKKNMEEGATDEFLHICIEPYEYKWLESVDVQLIRQPLEKIDRSLFSSLEQNDILFIDSSHVIKPQGDVLLEYLEILPSLKSGVLIHIHDIFSPKDYLSEWVCDKVRLWNEQYLLEAFLSYNHEFCIIGALNYLSHHYRDYLSKKCPIYSQQSHFREPGSFWLKRV